MRAQRNYENPKDSHILLHKKAKMKIPDTGSLKKTNNKQTKTKTQTLEVHLQKTSPIKRLTC